MLAATVQGGAGSCGPRAVVVRLAFFWLFFML